ncbi:hypothetical protein [Pseudomonas fluorescens]
MSTLAVFGMTIDVANSEARKKTSGTRKNLKAPGGVEPIPEPEWLEMVRKRAEKIMAGLECVSTRHCSTRRGTPSSSWSWLARLCPDLKIRAKAVLTDVKGKPILNPKTKVPKVGFTNWPQMQGAQAT